MLSLKNISAGYDSRMVVNDFSFDVPENTITLLAGPNGCGKSTVMKSIYRIIDLKKGTIIFGNVDLATLSQHSLLRMGIAFVPQNNNIFMNMTVLDNFRVAGFTCGDTKDFSCRLDYVLSILPTLKSLLQSNTFHLSGGERQMVALGMALFWKPRLLLFDEPLAGLSPNNVNIFIDIFSNLRDKEGITMLIVEHRVNNILSICDRLLLMNHGTAISIIEDTSEVTDKEIKNLYYNIFNQ